MSGSKTTTFLHDFSEIEKKLIMSYDIETTPIHDSILIESVKCRLCHHFISPLEHHWKMGKHILCFNCTFKTLKGIYRRVQGTDDGFMVLLGDDTVRLFPHEE